MCTTSSSPHPLVSTLVAHTVRLGVLLLLVTPLVLAQEPPEQRTFIDTLDVRAIEVEVVVTDADGEPVAGLDRSSFRLLVDGRETAVDYFDERRERLATTSSAPEAGTSLLVFVDDYFTDRRYRNALLRKLVDGLDTLGPQDRMAVVRFAGRKLEVVSDWSASPGELRGRLEQLRGRETGELIRQNRLRTTTWIADRYRLEIDEVDKSTGAACATLRSFPDPPGRKALVLVSTGWPDAPSVRQVIDTANLLGYTIYPLHLGAIATHHGVSAANRTPSAAFLTNTTQTSWQLAALDRLADETGGKLFAYTAILKRPLERLIDDVRSYYSLGFSPAWRQNDARHSIKVEVVGCAGCTVRHRQHFRDLSRAAQTSMRAEAALLVGAEGPPLVVALGAAQKSGLRAAEIPLEIRIPMDWATSLPTAEGYVAQLELRVAAIDAKGDRSEMPVIPVELKGPKPAPGSVAIYETRLQVRRRAQRLVLSLSDRVSGETLTSTLELDAKQKEATGGS